jgi:hypothetical protein
MLKLIMLPRQARDKHRENSKKETRFLIVSVGTLTNLIKLTDADGSGTIDCDEFDQVLKRVFSRHFYTKDDQFTKTGSGQT